MSDSSTFTQRQSIAMRFVAKNPGCSAGQVANEIATGSDARGAAQTLRSLTPAFVRRDGSEYFITDAGKAAIKNL